MQWYNYGLIPLVAAVTELVKASLLTNTRWVPLISLGLGVVLAMLLAAATPEPTAAFWIRTFFQGMVVGLSACGLYSGAKSVSGVTARERDRINELEGRLAVTKVMLDDALRAKKGGV